MGWTSGHLPIAIVSSLYPVANLGDPNFGVLTMVPCVLLPSVSEGRGLHRGRRIVQRDFDS